jgi:ribose-phosphate pyrophosphokinase
MTDAVLLSLPSGIGPAKRLARQLDIDCHEIAVHQFPDSELLVTAKPVAPVTIVYAPLDRPNDKLIALLLASEALRREGARRLVLVAPYMCYMRQDTAFHSGEAVSQKVIGKLVAEAFDRVITVDAHLHRTKSLAAVFPRIEADELSATPALAKALFQFAHAPQTIIVGPDEESEGWVRDLAGRLGLVHTVARKVRRGDRSVEISFPDSQSISGCNVLLLDDMVSSGGTIVACAKALRTANCQSIDVVITHALFNPETAASFVAAGIRSVRSADTVPHPSNSIELAEVLAHALACEIRP